MNKVKQIFAMLLAVSMVLALTACGDKTPAPIVTETPQTTEQTGTPATENATKTEAPGTQQPEENYVEGEILRSNGSSNFFVVDLTGKIIATYNKDELASKYDMNGYIADGNPVAYYKGNIIFSTYEYPEDGGCYAHIISFNPESKKLQVIKTLDQAGLEAIDAYNGLLYIDYEIYDDSRIYYEEAYDYSVAEERYVQTESPTQSLLDEFRPSYISFNTRHATAAYGMYECLTRTMDTCGFIAVSFDNEYMMLTQKGERQGFSERISYPTCYSEGYVYYFEYTEYGSTLLVYDIAKGISECITDHCDFVRGVSEGRLYFGNNFSGEYGITNNYYFMYDPWMKSAIEMFNVEEDPASGYSYDANGIFLAINDIVYYGREENGVAEVMKATPASGKSYKLEATGIIDATYGFEDINLNYISRTWSCDFCYNAVGDYYGEYPVLDRDVYAFADEINEFFLNEAMKDRDFFASSEYLNPTDDTFCSDHKEYWGRQTYDRDIAGIATYWDHYLCVDYSDYWYSGGAHGMPAIEQYLMDLTTGQRIRFADIYQGTEEEFKTIVAEHTKAYYNECYFYDNPFYAEDADQVYSEALESCYISDYSVTFGEDCLHYNFSPYSMGSFAAGFIIIDIPYSEVGLEGFFK